MLGCSGVSFLHTEVKSFVSFRRLTSARDLRTGERRLSLDLGVSFSYSGAWVRVTWVMALVFVVLVLYDKVSAIGTRRCKKIILGGTHKFRGDGDQFNPNISARRGRNQRTTIQSETPIVPLERQSVLYQDIHKVAVSGQVLGCQQVVSSTR